MSERRITKKDLVELLNNYGAVVADQWGLQKFVQDYIWELIEDGNQRTPQPGCKDSTCLRR
jgi:hypothetical protein